jgi:4-amino-4-deoxy-L-arabinose transferase-like glycosyltransferase
MPGTGSPQPALAIAPLLALSLATLVLHLISILGFAYGYMSDEFYYFACADQLAWGYVDHPPLSIAVLKLWRGAFGDSLLALRMVPTALACATVLLAGAIAREFGGGRAAQLLAALAVALSPVVLGVTSFYSMNAFEFVFWSTAAWLLARLVNSDDPHVWLWLGLVMGLGLLNKISMSWFGLGLGLGLVLTPQRRWLATRWPWIAAGIAAALFVPHVVWQVQHDWPTLEFMRNAAASKMVVKSPLDFAVDQLLVMNPLFAPFWIGGLVYFFASAAGRRHQVQAWIWIGVCALLVANGAVRANYLAPAYIPVLAAGGVAVERLSMRARRWLPGATAAVLVVAGLAVAPMAIELLPPRAFVGYSTAIGITAPAEEKTDFGALPMHFALRFGWPELLEAVERGFASLDPEERRAAVVIGSWFGDTGAIGFYGPERGLPRAVGGQNNFWLWGPGDASLEVALVIENDAAPLREVFHRVDRVAEVDCRYCMPRVDRLAVFAVRGLKLPKADAWAQFKRFH